MSIIKKVRAVDVLYAGLDKEIASFQEETSLHCKAGCGKCCTHAEVDASPLEFLPWAYHLFLNGLASKTLDDLTLKSSAICHIYQPLSLVDKDNGKGKCSDYVYRGLICRLFGYGANRNKFGEMRLATCKIIKEEQAANFEEAQIALSKGLYVPIFTDYYMKLSQIDFHLGNQIVPINTALKLAIEEVLQYYAYRPFPRGFKNCA
ncbi:YkgJ family cysteine cluster protein [Cellulophaga sp. E16_2]|uniref:YkgJ family cysteine cluster protein n=1 Tax=Cellulophaga sp. E16_2 TaxID=2789297 RepID=UPI001A90F86F|nr:YkgJ family cysteine cluster protein [Cellulophaga sp. E16_2]MBO0590315.1 YkgJ family cysteine cluster protein [Cellulophaga sp. E16_2]